MPAVEGRGHSAVIGVHEPKERNWVVSVSELRGRPDEGVSLHGGHLRPAHDRQRDHFSQRFAGDARDACDAGELCRDGWLREMSCGGRQLRWGVLAMSAITCASDMSRWTAATNGWRSIVSGVPSRAGSAGVTNGSGAWSMSVGALLSRVRFRPAPPLSGPIVVWNAGAPAWSVWEVCPWVRLLRCGVGRPVAEGAGAVGVLEMALSAPPRSGSGGGGGDGPCQTEARGALNYLGQLWLTSDRRNHEKDRNARAIDLRSLFFETKREKAQTRRNKRQGNWGLVVVCFRGPLHPKHTKNCAFRRAVVRVHYPHDMPQAPSQGTTGGTTRGKRGFGMTRIRVTHAHDTGARNDARDDALRRIIEATRARVQPPSPTPPPPPPPRARARGGRRGDDKRGKRGSG